MLGALNFKTTHLLGTKRLGPAELLISTQLLGATHFFGPGALSGEALFFLAIPLRFFSFPLVFVTILLVLVAMPRHGLGRCRRGLQADE